MRRFCSQACAREYQGYRHPCKHCGNLFRTKPSDVRNGRSYCSDACRAAAWGQLNRPRCERCGVEFPRRGKSNGTNRYCSKQCYLEHKAAKKRRYVPWAKIADTMCRRWERALRPARTCRICRTAVSGAASTCKHCRETYCKEVDCECGRGQAHEKWNGIRPCRYCVADKRRNQRRKQKKRNRSRGHKDRCEAKGLPFDASVSLQFVGERDGWTCRLCGIATLSACNREAPTIGHIVPLNNPLNNCHGHTKENTFLNCASCNGRQGNAVMLDGHQRSDNPRRDWLDHVSQTGYPLAQIGSAFRVPRDQRARF